MEELHGEAIAGIIKKNKELQIQEAAITAEYTKAVDDRSKSIMSFSGIFDEYAVKQDKSAEDLMNNLKTQVDGFKKWQENIAIFSAKAIDEGLIAELKAMGPKALAELEALNALTDAELEEYSKLYQEKQALARVEAEKELVGMKSDTEKRIQDLRDAVQSELDEINSVWKSFSAKSVNDTNEEFKQLVSVGQQAGKNLLDGLSSMENAFHSSGTLSAASAGSHTHDSGTLATNKTGAHSHLGNEQYLSTVVGLLQQHSSGTGYYLGTRGKETSSNGSHSHTISGSTASDGTHTHSVSGTTSSSGSHTHNVAGSTASIGGSQSHENRPPYYALAYIMKL